MSAQNFKDNPININNSDCSAQYLTELRNKASKEAFCDSDRFKYYITQNVNVLVSIGEYYYKLHPTTNHNQYIVYSENITKIGVLTLGACDSKISDNIKEVNVTSKQCVSCFEQDPEAKTGVPLKIIHSAFTKNDIDNEFSDINSNNTKNYLADPSLQKYSFVSIITSPYVLLPVIALISVGGVMSYQSLVRQGYFKEDSKYSLKNLVKAVTSYLGISSLEERSDEDVLSNKNSQSHNSVEGSSSINPSKTNTPPSSSKIYGISNANPPVKLLHNFKAGNEYIKALYKVGGDKSHISELGNAIYPLGVVDNALG